MAVTKSVFGKSPEGREISLYTLSNSKGMQAKVTDLGANLVGILVPDVQGVTADVTLGFDSVDRYYKNYSFFGAVIGPCANRTAGAAYTLDGVDYRMDQNDGPNNLHTHIELGFHKRIWDAVPGENSVTFSLEDEDGYLGFPGHKKVSVTYSLDEENALRLHYHASSDKRTIFNLTNHSYFNLSAGQEKIYHHQLYLNADQFGCVDDGCLATGELHEVEGTPFDFRQMHEIGEHIQDKDEQLKNAGGYDHTFVLNQGDEQIILYHEPSGRELHIHTSAPQVQLYSGNFLAGGANGKNGKPYENGDGVALETQLQPNSIHVEKEPSVILRKGQVFRSHTSYSFVVR